MRKEKGLRAVGRSKSSSAQEEPLVAMLLLVEVHNGNSGGRQASCLKGEASGEM